jgi:PIN domain nuclease of toxin-antitoxin system
VPKARIVLDASALMAVVKAEPGQERVIASLRDSCISTVNLAEVASKLVDHGLAWPEVELSLQNLELNVHAFDTEQAFIASALRQLTRSRGLSLGDRACLALAQTLNATILTADRAWTGLDRVELIR